MFKKNQQFTGIDFRDDYMVQATVDLETDTPKLINMNTVETKASIIENGRLADIKQTADRLKASLVQQPKTKAAHVALPTQNILVRRITHLPDLPEAQLAKLLDYQVGESIHLPFDTSIYDFVKIGTISEEETELPDELGEAEMQTDKSDLIFFSTSKPLSQDLLEMVTLTGLKPLTAEIRGIALQRLLMHTHPDWLAETEMVVDLSDQSIDIHIFTNGIIVFSRTMVVQIEGTGRQQASEDDNVLAFDGFLSGNAAADASHSSDEPYMIEIVQEIEKAQNFFRYSLSTEEDVIKRIILTGKHTDTAAAHLSERLDTVVKVIDFSPLTDGNFANNEQLHASSVAIGLALKGNDRAKKKWKK